MLSEAAQERALRGLDTVWIIVVAHLVTAALILPYVVYLGIWPTPYFAGQSLSRQSEDRDAFSGHALLPLSDQLGGS